MTHSILQEETLFRQPAYVVLNTRHLVGQLKYRLPPSPDRASDEATLVNFLQEILQLITIRDEAELTLQYESMGMVADIMKLWSHRAASENTLEMCKFLVTLGMEIKRQLEDAGVYVNGVMQYSYHMRLNDDVVLVQSFYNRNQEEALQPAEHQRVWTNTP